MIAILLSAGLSRRYNNGQKLIKPFRGKPLLYYSLSACLPFCDCIAVTGFQADETKKVLQSSYQEIKEKIPSCHALSIIYNPDFEKGQLSSILCGLGAIRVSDDFCILLSDTPEITGKYFEDMMAKFYANSTCDVFRSFYDTIPLHPVFFRGHCRDILLRYRDDRMCKKFNINALKDIIKRENFKISSCTVDDKRLAKDVDFLEDFYI